MAFFPETSFSVKELSAFTLADEDGNVIDILNELDGTEVSVSYGVPTEPRTRGGDKAQRNVKLGKPQGEIRFQANPSIGFDNSNDVTKNLLSMVMLEETKTTVEISRAFSMQWVFDATNKRGLRVHGTCTISGSPAPSLVQNQETNRAEVRDIAFITDGTPWEFTEVTA